MTISATTRGLRPGVCTSTTRPGSPYDGQLIYETDTNRVAVYDTNAWVYKTPASTTGSVLQVVSTTKTSVFTTTSTSFTDITGMSVSITPSSTSNSILVVYHAQAGITSGAPSIRLMRDSTAIAIGDAAGSRPRATTSLRDTGNVGTSSIAHLDSPSTTSSVTYKLQMMVNSGGTGTLNRLALDSDTSAYDGRTVSSITVMEIAG